MKLIDLLKEKEQIRQNFKGYYTYAVSFDNKNRVRAEKSSEEKFKNLQRYNNICNKLHECLAKKYVEVDGYGEISLATAVEFLLYDTQSSTRFLLPKIPDVTFDDILLFHDLTYDLEAVEDDREFFCEEEINKARAIRANLVINLMAAVIVSLSETDI